MNATAGNHLPHQGSTAVSAVVLTRISLQFDRPNARLVIDDLSLNIPTGSFVSLIGPSGCGKTSLLRIIADLERSSGGQALVDGLTPAEARKANRYAFVFQTPALLPWRTCLDNVRLPMQLKGWGRAIQTTVSNRALAIVGLKDVGPLYPPQLSGGMQQRVSIARALSLSPSILLMDEPFGALDEITREGLNLHLRELWARGGLTVVFVTHSIPEAVFLSSHVVVMSANPGRIVEIVKCDLPEIRPLAIRESAGFHLLTARVRSALEQGHPDG